MAGDWIKMRVGLTIHPRVLRMAESLLGDPDYLEWSGLSFGVPSCPAPSAEELRDERYAALRVTRYVTVTALLRFWGYANEHAKGCFVPGLWPEDVDEIAGVPGFSDAICNAGWAEFDLEDGGLTMPNFEEHNTSATERKSAASDRQKRYRERMKSERDIALRVTRDVTRDVTSHAREEKRREDINTPLPPKGGFAEFWKSYPRKIGKGAAEKAFAKVTAPLADLLAAIRTQGQSDQWRKDGGQYIPHPATWLNQRRWEDGGIETADTRPTGPDPALEKLKADSLKAAPMPANVREAIGALKGKVFP